MRPFLLALQFLTRIPITISGEMAEDELARSAGWFPMVGALIGGVTAAVAFVAAKLWPRPLIGWAALLLPLVLSGFLHLDGLMDTADGVLSGRSREKMLEIMRDSRVGAMGAAVAVVYILGHYLALTVIRPTRLIPALVLAPLLGRWVMAIAMIHFPYARSGPGTGRLFQGAGNTELFMATATCLGVTWLTLGWLGWLLAGAVLAVAMVAANSLASRLGGLTGDTYGAINQLAELMTLLILAAG